MTIENKIIQGNSYEVLSKLPSSSIDLVVTSPPYNLDISYDSYQDTMVLESYFQMLSKVFQECYRLLVPGGRLVVNLPSCIKQHKNSRMSYLSIDVLLLLREIGYLDREMITWIKNIPSKLGPHHTILPPGKSTSWGSWKQASCPYLRDASEFILVMSKESYKKEPVGLSDLTRSEFLAWSTNCWLMLTSSDRSHPATFPLELPRRAIKMYSYVDDLVLDPFNGSGTTCLAAKLCNRRYLGIDISKDYCDLARAKLRQEYLF